MSKSSEWDLERKEAIQKLKNERLDIEYQVKELLDKVAIINDQILLIDPSQV